MNRKALYADPRGALLRRIAFFIIFLFFILIALTGCADKGNLTLSEVEKNKIMEDIRSEIAGLCLGAERLNTPMAMKLFSNIPEFRSISVDGSQTGYASFYKNSDEFFKACDSVKFTKLRDDFMFLANDLVVYSWIYQARAVLKSGEHYDYDKIGATFLFKKVDLNWRAIYIHESASPPVITTGR